MGLARLLLVLLGAFVAACESGAFLCSSDAQCGHGSCQPSGHCSFPDAECPSGERYGEFAGELSGRCVGEPGTDGSSTGTSSTTAVTSSGSGTGSSTDPAVTSAMTQGGTTGAVASEDTSSGTSDDPPATSSSGDSSDDGTVGSGENDPYGPCDDGCTYPGGFCIMNAQMYSVCAVACSSPASPSDECPAPPQAGLTVSCINLAMGNDRACVIDCALQACPDGMTCTDPVCAWPPP